MRSQRRAPLEDQKSLHLKAEADRRGPWVERMRGVATETRLLPTATTKTSDIMTEMIGIMTGIGGMITAVRTDW